MTLSEAILQGMKLFPEQAHGETPNDRRACAFYGAIVAEGLPHFGIPHEWHWALQETAHCPVPECATKYYPVMVIGIHLNDHHRWSRERIASWISDLEVERVQPELELVEAL